MKGHVALFTHAAQFTLYTGMLTAILNTAPVSTLAKTCQPTTPVNPHTADPVDKPNLKKSNLKKPNLKKPNMQASPSDSDLNFSAAHMPPGAFLKQPGPDVAHLVEQVRSNPDVAIRYSRLFHLPIKLVPTAFAQLHLTTLREDRIMQVHFVRNETVTQTDTPPQDQPTGAVTRDNLIYKARRVKAGTKVYSLPDGTPLLIRVCGNPIRTRVAPEFYSGVSVPNFDPTEPLQDVATTRGIEPPTPRQPVVTTVAAENVLAVDSIPASPSLSPTELPNAALQPLYRWTHSFTGMWGFGGVGALDLITLADMGSHGSRVVIPGGNPPSVVPTPGTPDDGGTTPTTPTTPFPTPTPIVTEPPTPPDDGSSPGSGTSPGNNNSPGAVPEPTPLVLGAALLVVSVSLAGKQNVRPKYPNLA